MSQNLLSAAVMICALRVNILKYCTLFKTVNGIRSQLVRIHIGFLHLDYEVTPLDVLAIISLYSVNNP